MKRVPSAWLRGGAYALCCLLLTLSAHRVAASETFVVHDDLNRDVELVRHPQRIITMLPSLTETVCALGACDRLVATDRFSNWPARTNTLREPETRRDSAQPFAADHAAIAGSRY
jgi:iron complex transport system substrate-binding protein